MFSVMMQENRFRAAFKRVSPVADAAARIETGFTVDRGLLPRQRAAGLEA